MRISVRLKTPLAGATPDAKTAAYNAVDWDWLEDGICLKYPESQARLVGVFVPWENIGAIEYIR